MKNWNSVTTEYDVTLGTYRTLISPPFPVTAARPRSSQRSHSLPLQHPPSLPSYHNPESKTLPPFPSHNILPRNSIAPSYSSHRTIKTDHYRRPHGASNHLEERQLNESDESINDGQVPLDPNTSLGNPHTYALKDFRLAEFVRTVTAEEPVIPLKPSRQQY